MKKYLLVLALALGGISAGYMLHATPAAADTSWTCSTQNDGSKFCTGVDDNGKNVCQTCPANGSQCVPAACK